MNPIAHSLRSTLLSVLFLAVFGMATHARAQEQTLKVVTSFSILEDWVSLLGGEHVTVSSMVGLDEDVHVYHATPKELREVAQADLMVINGLGLEGWFERLISATGFKGTLLKATEEIPAIFVERGQDEHHHGHHHDHAGHEEHEHDDKSGVVADPHAWLSPRMALHYVSRITQTLIELAPQHKAAFLANQNRYAAQLVELDNWLRQRIETIPEVRRQVVVPHASFRYFERDYGIRFHSLQGMSNHSESSASELAVIVRYIREHNLQAIFAENIANRRLIERVAAETGQGLSGVLLTGALSKTIASDYLSLVRYNANTLLKALAPE